MSAKGKGKASTTMNVLGDKMQANVDTLKVIRRLHRKLADGTRETAIEVSLSSFIIVGGSKCKTDLVSPLILEQPENIFENDLSESDDLDQKSKGTRRKKSAAAPKIGSTSIPKSAFRTHLAGEAADASLKTISAGVLTHAGFEGTHF